MPSLGQQPPLVQPSFGQGQPSFTPQPWQGQGQQLSSPFGQQQQQPSLTMGQAFGQQQQQMPPFFGQQSGQAFPSMRSQQQQLPMLRRRSDPEHQWTDNPVLGASTSPGTTTTEQYPTSLTFQQNQNKACCSEWSIECMACQENTTPQAFCSAFPSFTLCGTQQPSSLSSLTMPPPQQQQQPMQMYQQQQQPMQQPMQMQQQQQLKQQQQQEEGQYVFSALSSMGQAEPIQHFDTVTVRPTEAELPSKKGFEFANAGSG